jgi:hypothetical protein
MTPIAKFAKKVKEMTGLVVMLLVNSFMQAVRIKLDYGEALQDMFYCPK